MKPRIAVVSSYFPTLAEPFRGHSAYQTLLPLREHAELRAFVPLVHYPAWYTRRPREFRYGQITPSAPPGCTIPAEYFTYATLPLAGRPFNGELCYRQVRRAVAKFRPDLVLNYWLYPDGYAAVRVARELGVPAVVASLGSDLRRIGDRATSAWTRWLLRRAGAVIVVSRELGAQAVRRGAPAERVHAILNGCDAGIFHPGDRAAERARLRVPEQAKVIVYVGSLIPSKGLPELMDAFLRLRNTHPDLMLVCGGEGPYAGELQRQAAAAGLADYLILPGQLSGPQVRDWVVAADVFALPSHSEGCPNVVIEALACGRPVVASRVGGIPELVDARNGVLVEPGNAAELAGALTSALAREWDEQAISAACTRTWHEVAEETWGVCSQLLSRKAL